MKTPDTDNRIVDYLYDDLPDAQREEFSATLKSNEAGAAEAKSFATLLKIYREESDELTPSVAATERLMRQAERAHQSLWARLFADLLPRMVLRPSMGFAMVAILVIGGGVFWVLSQGFGQGPGRGTTSADKAESPGDRTVASAPAPASVSTKTVLAEKGRYYGTDKRARAADELAVDGKVKGVRTGAASTVFQYKYNKKGALAAGDDADQERGGATNGLRGRLSRRPAKAKKRAFKTRLSNTRGVGGSAGGPRKSQPASRAEQSPPAQVADTTRTILKKPKSANQAPQGKNVQKKQQKLAPPALHNRAQTNFAKGKVAVACHMFGSLVRGHRSYSRRADALLGWARCEIARGSFSRARQIVRQLVSQYPKWKKTGTSLLARIKRLQAQAALRAQRVRRVRRKVKAATPRAAPARRSNSQRSTSSD